jgi:putative transcriptional regulator
MLKNRLKSWRYKMEMNQKQFYAFLDINKDQYGRYERNEQQPSIEVAWKIAQKLNCHIEELFEEVPE